MNKSKITVRCNISAFDFQEGEIYDILEYPVINSEGYSEYVYNYNDVLYTQDCIDEYFSRVEKIYHVSRVWIEKSDISGAEIENYVFTDKELARQSFNQLCFITRDTINRKNLNLNESSYDGYMLRYNDDISIKVELTEDIIQVDSPQQAMYEQVMKSI